MLRTVLGYSYIHIPRPRPLGHLNHLPKFQDFLFDWSLAFIVELRCLDTVFSPTTVENYKRRTAEGLSTVTIGAAFLASVLTLCRLALREEDILLFIAVTLISAQLLAILYQLVFLESNLVTQRLATGTVVTALAFSIIWSRLEDGFETIVDWLCLFLWCIAILPQIWLHANQRSTQGIASLTVLLATCASAIDIISCVLMRSAVSRTVGVCVSAISIFLCALQLLHYQQGNHYSKRMSRLGRWLAAQLAGIGIVVAALVLMVMIPFLVASLLLLTYSTILTVGAWISVTILAPGSSLGDGDLSRLLASDTTVGSEGRTGEDYYSSLSPQALAQSLKQDTSTKDGSESPTTVPYCALIDTIAW